MERESFEDHEVAKILNTSFISIKVDREERPDIDSIYMGVCQMLTGSGGWPLSIFLDGEKNPFYAGTYLPKKRISHMMGFIELLEEITDFWKNERLKIFSASSEILGEIKRREIRKSAKEISEKAVSNGLKNLGMSFDRKNGGFGRAPKFPTPHNLLFLMRASIEQDNKEAFEMVEKTLEAMAKGGIYDHIGFGFCRYSTDERWFAPHFEKMLYDNALLAIAYAEAFHITGKNFYSEIVNEILEYVLRDMTSPEGGFYSAEDADSEGIEGKFYLWGQQEVIEILGKADGEKFCEQYSITEKGNFEHRNIPYLTGRDFPNEETRACLNKLFTVREKRIHPLKDTKVLTSWNGLMIAALSIAGRITKNNGFIDSAKKAVDFIYRKMFKDEVLYARYCGGELGKTAFAEDYAFLTWGLLELYSACFDEDYLIKAVSLTDTLLDDFWDNDSAGFFLYGEKSEKLISRPKEIYDGATPSANSVSINNLIRISRLVGNISYGSRAKEILDYFSSEIESATIAHTHSLSGLMRLTSSQTSVEIVIAAESFEAASPAINLLNSKFRPFTSTVLYIPNSSKLASFFDYFKNYSTNGRPWAAYVCRNFSCSPPVYDVKSLHSLL